MNRPHLPGWATRPRVRAAGAVLAVAALAGTGWNVVELQRDLGRECRLDQHQRAGNRLQNQVLRGLVQSVLDEGRLPPRQEQVFRAALHELSASDRHEAPITC